MKAKSIKARKNHIGWIFQFLTPQLFTTKNCPWIMVCGTWSTAESEVTNGTSEG